MNNDDVKIGIVDPNLGNPRIQIRSHLFGDFLCFFRGRQRFHRNDWRTIDERGSSPRLRLKRRRYVGDINSNEGFTVGRKPKDRVSGVNSAS